MSGCTPASSCKVVFLKYYGALTAVRSTQFWNVWSLCIWMVAAIAHTVDAYVTMRLKGSRHLSSTIGEAMYISSPVHSGIYDLQVFDLRSPGDDASLEAEFGWVALFSSSDVEGCLETKVDYPGVPGSREDANVVSVHRQVDVRDCWNAAGIPAVADLTECPLAEIRMDECEHCLGNAGPMHLQEQSLMPDFIVALGERCCVLCGT
ncbi:hypothetical protein Trydic_g17257 [Trypoxylus dichotomus]